MQAICLTQIRPAPNPNHLANPVLTLLAHPKPAPGLIMHSTLALGDHSLPIKFAASPNGRPTRYPRARHHQRWRVLQPLASSDTSRRSLQTAAVSLSWPVTHRDRQIPALDGLS
jgi:hypothetical protein